MGKIDFKSLLNTLPCALEQGQLDRIRNQCLKANAGGASLAIMVSCIGRRLVLGQRIEEELEAVIRSLPEQTETVGFYSYGEACPSAGNDFSELHNQTMTITIIGEKV